MNRAAAVLLAAASALAAQGGPTQQVMQAAMTMARQGSTPWRRAKLRNTRTTVAAMKRAARKRRNIAKRRGAA
jgi:hypothetical protein